MSLAERYQKDGIVHIRGVFGTREVEGAIRAVAHLPEWVRGRSGNRDVQRVQPLQSCPVVEDSGWINAFYENPRLDRAIGEIFRGMIDPVPRMSRDLHLTGLLIEPLDHWWSTGLHRDYRDFIFDLDVAAWRTRAEDWRLFNQINIPLLPDASFWAVPGSHLRDDSEDEARLVRSRSRYGDDKALGDGGIRRNQLCEALRSCGAVNIEAGPGDLVLYRSNMLHCGVYEPGVRRLTLHDAVYSLQWHRYALEMLAHARAS